MSIETRTYADADRARAAIDELSAKGFSDVKALFKPDHVRVVVNARFGEGRNASEILDRHGPLTSARRRTTIPTRLRRDRRPGFYRKFRTRPPHCRISWAYPSLRKGLSRARPKVSDSRSGAAFELAELADPVRGNRGRSERSGRLLSIARRKTGRRPAGTPAGQRPDSASKEGDASSGTPAEERRHDSPSSDAEAVSGTMGDDASPGKGDGRSLRREMGICRAPQQDLSRSPRPTRRAFCRSGQGRGYPRFHLTAPRIGGRLSSSRHKRRKSNMGDDPEPRL